MEWWQSWLTLIVIIGVFLGLIRNFSSDLLLVGALVVCGIFGIIKPEEAFSGFSNTGMLTVAALYVVVAGLTETGGLEIIGMRLLGKIKTEFALLKRMALSVPLISAFLNNTPIVAMFIPIISNWCNSNRISPSRFLIPLSYFSILGGTCTLIGTSTNLVVNGLMIEKWNENKELYGSLHSMSLFELSTVGIPYAIIGAVFILFWGRKVLPRYENLQDRIEDTRREYLVNMVVGNKCILKDQTVEKAGLRHLPGLFLIEITRNDRIITPVSPDEIILENDILTFTGIVSTIVDLEKIAGLNHIAADQYAAEARKHRAGAMCEVVLSNTFPLIGVNVRESDFRAMYNAAIIAIHRGGARLKGKVGDMVLRAGDTLLIQAGPHFIRAHRNNPDFFLVSGVDDSRPVRHHKTMVSISLIGLLILLMASGVIPIVYSAFLVGSLMILTGCVSFSVARQKIDWQTLITIAAAFGLGKALVNSGVVQAVTVLMVNSIGQWGGVAVLAAIFVLTSIFTEIITNNAAAALMFPFAISAAFQMGCNPRAFAMAVVFGASASFATPLGYQTNLMVYGPGGYRVTDFLKMGLPLNLILLVTAVLLIPVFWPL